MNSFLILYDFSKVFIINVFNKNSFGVHQMDKNERKY